MLTTLIAIATVAVSFLCFRDGQLFDKLSLRPYRMVRHGEWHRIVTHGFVHADWVHLFVNMFTFWSFGEYIEQVFAYLGFGGWAFLALYFGGMAAASVSDIVRYRNNPAYASIGASGAVSAVLFSSPASSSGSSTWLIASTWHAAAGTTSTTPPTSTAQSSASSSPPSSIPSSSGRS